MTVRELNLSDQNLGVSDAADADVQISPGGTGNLLARWAAADDDLVATARRGSASDDPLRWRGWPSSFYSTTANATLLAELALTANSFEYHDKSQLNQLVRERCRQRSESFFGSTGEFHPVGNFESQ